MTTVLNKAQSNQEQGQTVAKLEELEEKQIKLMEIMQKLVEVLDIRDEKELSQFNEELKSYHQVVRKKAEIEEVYKKVVNLVKELNNEGREIKQQIIKLSTKLSNLQKELHNPEISYRTKIKELTKIGVELKSIEEKINFIKITKGVEKKLKEVGKALLGLLAITAKPIIVGTKQVSKCWQMAKEKTKELINEQVKTFKSLGQSEQIKKLKEVIPSCGTLIEVMKQGLINLVSKPKPTEVNQLEELNDEQWRKQLSDELDDELDKLENSSSIENDFKETLNQFKNSVQAISLSAIGDGNPELNEKLTNELKNVKTDIEMYLNFLQSLSGKLSDLSDKVVANEDKELEP